MEKLSERKSLQTLIEEVQERLREEGLPGGDIFARAMKETLDKAVREEPDGSTFVLTGDIPAMWLRDAACQVRPYLFLAKEDEAFGRMIEGLVQRMVQCILIDPYAGRRMRQKCSRRSGRESSRSIPFASRCSWLTCIGK